MQNKKEMALYGFIAFIFIFFQLACRAVEVQGNVEWNVRNLCFCFGISIGFAVITVLVLLAGKKCFLIVFQKRNYQEKKVKFNSKKVFWISWVIILACWMPLFLAYYPGILAYDSYVQIEQITSGAYNNHHPLIHTFLIKMFLDIGNVLGSVNLGTAMYTVTQMLALSGVMAWGVSLLSKKGVGRFWLTVVVLYCGLNPANSYLAISMTKDVYFTVFVLVFAFCLLKHGEMGKQHLMWDVVYVAATIFMILFRNNGMYALLVCICMYVFFAFLGFCFRKKKSEDEAIRKEKRRKFWILLIETAIGIFISLLILGGLNRSVDARDGDKREMLSIPIQQIARCMVYHGGVNIRGEDDNSISDTDKALINEFILDEGYAKYNPSISDPVKRCTNTWVVLNKMKEFLSMYIRLALDYPSDYLNAFLAVNSGYLSVIDESHAQVNLYGNEMGLGYLQTRWEMSTISNADIYKESKWPVLYEKMEKFASNNGYLDIPIVRQLVAPGMYLWCYLLLAVWIGFNREKQWLTPFYFVIGYYVTLVLGPTVQLRYLYPLMVLLPFYYFYVLNSRDKISQTIGSGGQQQ